MLDWEERPEVVRKKHEKVVVIKNIFTLDDSDVNIVFHLFLKIPLQFDDLNFCYFSKRDPKFVSKLRDELRNELETYGEIKKILIQVRALQKMLKLISKEF
jgi:hypothetical protein